MNRKVLTEIPISEIRIVNPRTRSKIRFKAIVSSIETVGLKKPITVTKRAPSEDGTQYDLVCGQGRIEAFRLLGQSTIPASVIDASKEDQYVMSLVENIARRPPSSKDLLKEIVGLRGRGYDAKVIATKIGRDADFVASIIRLVDRNETALIEAVEANRLPISVALLISSADYPGIQRALSEAYESGALRGARFKDAKRIIAKHTANRRESGQPKPARAASDG